MYAGGPRISGNHNGNTNYQDLVGIAGHTADIGFTLRDYSVFNFNSLSSGGNSTNFCNVSMSSINLNEVTVISGSFQTGKTKRIKMCFNSSRDEFLEWKQIAFVLK